MIRAEDATKAAETVKPPVTGIGVLGWMRANLFNGWFNTLLTLATLFALGKIVPPLVRWAFVDSSWSPDGDPCREAAGRLLVDHPGQHPVHHLRVLPPRPAVAARWRPWSFWWSCSFTARTASTGKNP